jgi:hypothetical protein
MKRAPTKTKYRFRLIQDESLAQLAGVELTKLAEQLKVNDIRQLDAATVCDIVLNDKKHPLRKLPIWGDFDTKTAARKHWIETTRRLISGIQIVTYHVGKREHVSPMFVSAEAPTKKEGSRATRRSHVMTADSLAHDPVFMSAVGTKLRTIFHTLQSLEQYTSARQVPENLSELLATIREAVDAYNGTMASEAA